jgi:TRAP-type C4-dicarboxylate transport system permease small subunit
VHRFRRFLEKTDHVIYHCERSVLLLSVVMMTVLVFLDVVQRTFSRPVGKTAAIFTYLASLFGDLSDASKAAIGSTWGPGIFWLFTAAFVISASHTGRTIYAKRKRARMGETKLELQIAPLPSLLLGLVVTGGIYAGIKVLLMVAPSGIAGAQKFALGFLVWSGFLGASLATRSNRHIVLDAVTKKIETRTRVWFSAIAGVLISMFCGLIVYLGAKKTVTEIIEWHESNGVIHVYEALPIPVWLVSIAIPLVFFLIGIRCLAYGFGELLYGPSLGSQEDVHGIDFKALSMAQDTEEEEQAKEAARLEEEKRKSNIIGEPSSDSAILLGEWE